MPHVTSLLISTDWPSEGVLQNAGQTMAAVSLSAPSLQNWPYALQRAKWWLPLRSTSCLLSHHTDQEEFSRRSRHSAPLNASTAWGANGRHIQRPNTGEGRGSQQAPYLVRSSGPKCCSPLTFQLRACSGRPAQWLRYEGARSF